MTDMRIMQYAGAEVMGGLLAHVARLTGGLVKEGHSVHVILSPSRGADRAARGCESAGATVTRLAVRGKGDVSGMMNLARLVASDSPEVLHVHLSSPIEAMPALLAARLGGVPHLVTTEHAPTWFPLERHYSVLAKQVTGKLLDAVIAVSESDARFLKSHFRLPEALVTVIPNGIPEFDSLHSRPEARSGLDLPCASSLIVGYMGALEPKKGVLDLVEAFRDVTVPDRVLVLAGEGTLLEDLRCRATELPFQMVIPGWIRETGKFLSALDLFVLPSHQEAMPLAMLEAMLAGLPVIASRVGGIPEVVRDGVTGLLVDPGDVSGLALRIRRAADDIEGARRLGQAARCLVRERFSLDRMVRRISDLYASVATTAETRSS